MADTVKKPGEGSAGTKPVVDGTKLTFGSTVTIGGVPKTVIGWVWPCMGQPGGALVTLEDALEQPLNTTRLKFEDPATGTKP